MTTAEGMEVGGEWGGIELVFVMSTCEIELEVGHVELYARLDNMLGKLAVSIACR